MFLKYYIYLSFAASVFLCVHGYAISKETNYIGCTLPSHPSNGKWKIIGGSEASPGSTVPPTSVIIFFCNEEYKISSDYSMIICLGKDWNLPSPVCLKKIPNGDGEVLIENKGSPNRLKRQIALGERNENGVVVEDGRTSVNSQPGVSVGGKDGVTTGSGGITIGAKEGGGIVINNQGIKVGVENEGQEGDEWMVLIVRKNKEQPGDGKTYFEDKKDEATTNKNGSDRKKRQTVTTYSSESSSSSSSYSSSYSKVSWSTFSLSGGGGNGVVVYGGTINGDIIGYGGGSGK